MTRNDNSRLKSALLFLGMLFLFCACAGNSNKSGAPAKNEQSDEEESTTQPAPTPSPSQGAKLGNPASTNCLNNGGTLEILDGEKGQFGVCIFEDGSRCEEWRFFRKECAPAPGECREPSRICE